MKVLVISDSHGYRAAIRMVMLNESPDLVLHLGDNVRDCGIFREEFPETPLRVVRGNGDFGSAGLDVDEFELEGKKFFMTHGHLYDVKMTFSSIIRTAKEREVDILLFGHTHKQYFSSDEGFIMLNPGSIGGAERAYAIIEISGGEVFVNTYKS